MAGQPVGTMYVELTMDSTRYTKAQKAILEGAKQNSADINKVHKTVGITSDAMYDAMRKNVENALTAIKKSHVSSKNEIVRAEQAAAEKLKKIHTDQFGKQISLMESVKKNWLGIAAAIYGVQRAASFIAEPFIKGFNAVEDYAQSVASLSAMVVTFSERQKGMSLESQWKNALEYSQHMVPVLENLAAKTLLTGQETNALANAFARSGVFLDDTNSKQIESFTRISNALPLMTKGQEIMRQINSEIRAVMTGANESTSMMLQTLKAIDPEIEKNLKTWRASGTVLENIGELLVGFGPATALLENQWQAVKSTLDTTVTQILRGGMSKTYDEIIDKVKLLNEYLVENKDAIENGMAKSLRGVAETIEGIIKTYNSLPDGLIGASGAGIVGRMLFGSWGMGAVLGGLVLIDEQLKTWGQGIGPGDIAKEYNEAVTAMNNFRIAVRDVMSGDRDSSGNPLPGSGIKPIVGYEDALKTHKTDKLLKDYFKDYKIKPKVVDEAEETAEKNRRERRIALEREYLADYAIMTTEGQEQELEKLKKNYENKLAEAKKYGASTVMLEKQYKFERDKILAQGDDYWKYHHELAIKQQTKADQEYFDSMADYAGYTYKKINTEEMKAKEKALKEQEKLYDHMLERVQDETADVFYDIFSGNVSGWDDMLGRMKDLFFRYLAEMAAEAIAKPIIMPIVQEITGMLGLGGAGAAGKSIAGDYMSSMGISGSTLGWIGAAIMLQHSLSQQTNTVFEGQKTGDAFSGNFGTEPWLAFMNSKLGWGPTAGEKFDAAIKNKEYGTAFLRSFGVADYWSDPARAFGYNAISNTLGSGAAWALDPLSSAMNWLGSKSSEIGFSGQGVNLLSGALDFSNDSVPGSLRGQYNQITSAADTVFEGWQDKIKNLLKVLPAEMSDSVEKYFTDNQLTIPGMKIGFDKDVESRMQQFQGTVQLQIEAMIHTAFERVGFESEAAIDAFIEKMELAGETSAVVVSNALKNSIYNNDFTMFGQSIKDTIYQNVTDGVLEALMQSEMFKAALTPVFYGLQNAMDSAFASGNFDLETFMNMATPYLGQVNNAISQLEPAFDFVSTTLMNAKNQIYNGTANTGIRQQDIAGYNTSAAPVTNVNISGVITTDEVDGWLGRRLQRLQEKRIGTNYTSTNTATAGLN